MPSSSNDLSTFSFATRSFDPSELWTGGEAPIAFVGIDSATTALSTRNSDETRLHLVLGQPKNSDEQSF
jgi:hypothetical protein